MSFSSPLAIVAAVVTIYLLPGIIAVLRGKRYQWVILSLDILLGWTLVGWVVAVLWALAGDKPRVVRQLDKGRARVTAPVRPASPEIATTSRTATDGHANDNAGERAAPAYAWDDDVVGAAFPDAYADWLESGAALASSEAVAPAKTPGLAA